MDWDMLEIMVRVRVTGFLVLTVTNNLCDQKQIA